VRRAVARVDVVPGAEVPGSHDAHGLQREASTFPLTMDHGRELKHKLRWTRRSDRNVADCICVDSHEQSQE
jgi:hypothetical protein